jgi:transcriptional regulator with PAS, ATPase and Fis domain
MSQKFIERFALEFKKQVKGLSPESKKLFMLYRWPGNVRELKNVIERAMILENEEYITPDHLPAEIVQAGDVKVSQPQPAEELGISIPEGGVDIENIEKELLKKALMMAKGNQSKAARLLNLGRDAFRYRIQKFGLDGESRDA